MRFVPTRIPPSMAMFGLLPLLAQTPQEGLAILPTNTESIACYPRPKESESRFAALNRLFDSSDGMMDLLKKQVGLSVDRLDKGVLIEAKLPGEKSESEAKVYLLPSAAPRKLLSLVNAHQVGKIWQYKVKGSPQPVLNAKGRTAPKNQAAATEDRFAAPKGKFLVVATTRKALDHVLASTEGLTKELSPWTAWIDTHDVSWILTEHGSAKVLGDLVKDLAAEAKPGTPAATTSASVKAITNQIRALAEKAQSSVRHMVVAADASPDGAFTCHARISVKAGSALISDLMAIKSLGAHPLAGLPRSPYALAMGGHYPAIFKTVMDLGIASLEDDGEKTPTEVKDRYQAALHAQQDLIKNFAFALGTPASPDAPFFSNATNIFGTGSSEAYLKATKELAEAQNAYYESKGLGSPCSFQTGVLPGVESWTLRTDFGKTMGSKTTPAQVKMFTTMLLGGDTMRFSCARLDDKRVLGVMGGAEELKAVFEKAKEGKGLESLPALTVTDKLLLQDPRFALYLDLKGLRNLASGLLAAFASPKAKGIPEIPEVPPMGVAITVDASGLEARAVALPETLKALAGFVKSLGALMPVPPTQEPPSEKDKEDTDED